MTRDTFDLEKIERFISRHPDVDIWILSNGLNAAKVYWDNINIHLKINKKPYFVSNHKHSLDGLTPFNALVLKCGNWWENKNSTQFIENYSGLVKYIIPVTYIPPVKRGI